MEDEELSGEDLEDESFLFDDECDYSDGEDKDEEEQRYKPRGDKVERAYIKRAIEESKRTIEESI